VPASDSQPRRRKAQGVASRERLLDAAVELFAERGYAATSVDALCRRAGTAPTALYWHFERKEGLLAAALDRVAGTWIEAIVNSVYQVGDPMERLDRAVARMRALVEEDPHLLRLLLTVMLERSDGDPAARRTLQRIFGRTRAAIARGIEDAFGTAIPDVDHLAHVALSLLEGAALRQQLEPQQTDLAEIFRFTRRCLAVLIGERASAVGIERPGSS
jgi:AcrR family transcriptional regulator